MKKKTEPEAKPLETASDAKQIALDNSLVEEEAVQSDSEEDESSEPSSVTTPPSNNGVLAPLWKFIDNFGKNKG